MVRPSLVETLACPGCLRLVHHARVKRARHKVDRNKIHIVRSWCRVCGLPAMLEMINDYEQAKRSFYSLDDQPMAHRKFHAERGGWGVHWRLDEVLATLFPHEEHCWPTPPWYTYEASMEHPVSVLHTKEEIEEAGIQAVNLEIRMLQRMINDRQRNREEIEKDFGGPVWNTQELAAEFNVLGYRAPFAIVENKTTRQRGSVMFQHEPRFYFGFDQTRVI